MLGAYVLSAGYYDAYYLKVQKARTLVRQDFDSALRQCNVIVTPNTPTIGFKIEEMTEDSLRMYLSDIFTVPVNLAGLSALSLPCGFDRTGLPIGMQIIGCPFYEATVLRLGHAFQQARDWHRRSPWT